MMSLAKNAISIVGRGGGYTNNDVNWPQQHEQQYNMSSNGGGDMMIISDDLRVSLGAHAFEDNNNNLRQARKCILIFCFVASERIS